MIVSVQTAHCETYEIWPANINDMTRCNLLQQLTYLYQTHSGMLYNSWLVSSFLSFSILMVYNEGRQAPEHTSNSSAGMCHHPHIQCPHRNLGLDTQTLYFLPSESVSNLFTETECE